MGNLKELERELCHEEELFNRLISGLHASINSHIFEFYIDPETKENSPNYEAYFERVGNFPERIENIYFAYSVLLRFFLEIMRNDLEFYWFLCV